MNNRVLFVGDVHGHDQWRKPVFDALGRSADVVFVGDYFDSYTEDGITVYDNMTDILEIKKQYPDRITILLGNHEYVYLMGNQIASTTGTNEAMAIEYHRLLDSNWQYFDLTWGIRRSNGRYLLASHAGLTNAYYEKFIVPEFDTSTNIGKLIAMEEVLARFPRVLPLHEKLNFFKDKLSILWQVGLRTDFPTGPGSIIWADKTELIQDPYPGIDQIVGHTAGNFIDCRISKDCNLYFINLREDIHVGTIMMEI